MLGARLAGPVEDAPLLQERREALCQLHLRTQRVALGSCRVGGGFRCHTRQEEVAEEVAGEVAFQPGHVHLHRPRVFQRCKDLYEGRVNSVVVQDPDEEGQRLERRDVDARGSGPFSLALAAGVAAASRSKSVHVILTHKVKVAWHPPVVVYKTFMS